MTTDDINERTDDFTRLNICDVTCLRQDHAVTVRLPSLTERPCFTSLRRSKRLHQDHVTSGFWCLSTCCREISSNTYDQLPLVSATQEPTKRANVEGPCGCNYSKEGSLVISSIRQRLSSPFLHFTSSHSTLALPKIKDFLFVLFFLILILNISPTHATSSNSQPLTRTDATTDTKFGVFKGKGPYSSQGKRSAHGFNPLDFQALKIIPNWGGTKNVLLLSGRDYIYMINASAVPEKRALRYSKVLQWSSDLNRKRDCQNMGKSKFECNNFIRVLELQKDENLYVCGTNSYHPICRYYSKTNFTKHLTSRESRFSEDSGRNLCAGQCPCPYNPTKSSATLYSTSPSGHQLFSATLNNFVANLPVFMRNSSDPPLYSLDNWFNDPTFIKLVEAKNGKIYLFFRETATSVETGKDPATYGRIAQVCKNDRGGTTVLEGIWTSFLKARLKCSISGSANEAAFTFDNLTSISNITTVTGLDGRPKDVIFATFTTPWNWREFSMSAVCVYAMEDIEELFDSGRFLSERTLHIEPSAARSPMNMILKAVPVSNWEVPTPRPGQCLNNTISLTYKTLHFAKEHFLMYDSVTPINDEPLFITEKNIQATQIVVDDTDGEDNIVAYVGTENGKILRIRPNFRRQNAPKALLLEEMSVAEDCESRNKPCGVLALNVYRPKPAATEAALFVAFTDRLVRVPLTTCSQYVNEECCNVDPICGWHGNKCLPRSSDRRLPFPATSPVKEISDNCQAPIEKSSECDISRLIFNLPELCGESIEKSTPEKQRQIGGRRLSPPDESVGLRSISRGRSEPVQSKRKIDKPNRTSGVAESGERRRCENVRESRIPEIRNIDNEVAELFIQHVLPSISSEFSDTIRSLPNEERQAILLQQLRDAMVDTARLVLNNHRMDHCLPTDSVNSLTHSYPLLLRELESWHDLAIRKMVPDKRWTCWQNIPGSNCTFRLSFSIPLAPTLWAPLASLIKDFGGKCDTITPPPEEGGVSGGCQVLPGVLPCKDKRTSNSSLCQIRKCRFSEYEIDVRAFFRHANHSRNFLPADSSVGPFEKVVERKIKKRPPLRSLLKLSLNRKQPFQIYYIPATEKIKITFHYAHAPLRSRGTVTTVRERSSRRTESDERTDGCQLQLETKLDTWFEFIISHLNPGIRNCQRQIKKANRDLTIRESRERGRSHEDNRLLAAPSHCHYIKKTFVFPPKFWNSLVERAVNSGGRHMEEQKSIVFTNRNGVINFFSQRCSGISEREEINQNMQQLVFKKRKGSRPGEWVKAEVKVSNETPFRIEQLKSGRVRLKYFTGRAR